MAMGMSLREYWDESPYNAIYYQKAYKLRRKMDNEQAWLQGLYIYDAFSVVLSNAFGKKGGTKHQYIEKPLDIFPLTESEKKEREAEERLKAQKTLVAIVQQQKSRKKKGD